MGYRSDRTKLSKIACIHTTHMVIDRVHALLSPGFEVLHFLDEGILAEKERAGCVTDKIIAWLRAILIKAGNSGVEAAVVTCSSLSPAVLRAALDLDFPVLRIDYPLVRWILIHCENPCVIMTNPTTHNPSQNLFKEVGQELGINRPVEFVLLKEAFHDLQSGHTDRHDQAVQQAVERAGQQHDGIVLAQISIARVKENLNREIQKKVYSSLDFIDAALKASIKDKQ